MENNEQKQYENFVLEEKKESKSSSKTTFRNLLIFILIVLSIIFIKYFPIILHSKEPFKLVIVVGSLSIIPITIYFFLFKFLIIGMKKILKSFFYESNTTVKVLLAIFLLFFIWIGLLLASCGGWLIGGMRIHQ